MERRSTNDIGYTHFTGDVTAQVGSSHGVRLSGGSTGGVVEAVGDDTNIYLSLWAQGAGGVRVGRNSSQAVHVVGDFNSSGAFTYAGSTFVVTPLSTGGITFGTSSNPVAIAGSSVAVTSTHINLNSSRTVIGASTTPVILVQRSRIDFTIPAMSSQSADETVEVAVTGLTTNALIFIQQRKAYNSSVATGIDVKGYCSTAGALRLTFFNHTASTISGSTMSADLWRIECPVAIP